MRSWDLKKAEDPVSASKGVTSHSRNGFARVSTERKGEGLAEDEAASSRES